MVSLAGRGVGKSQSLTEKTDHSPGHELNLREQAQAPGPDDSGPCSHAERLTFIVDSKSPRRAFERECPSCTEETVGPSG